MRYINIYKCINLCIYSVYFNFDNNLMLMLLFLLLQILDTNLKSMN